MPNNVEYVINKIPSGKPPIKIRADFPELYNLHLDLMENKKKLKSGLPNLKDTPNNTEFDKRRPNPEDQPNLFIKSGNNNPKNKKNEVDTNEEDDAEEDEDDFGADSEGVGDVVEDDEGEDDEAEDEDDDDIDEEFLSDEDEDEVEADDDVDDGEEDDDSLEEDEKPIKKTKSNSKNDSPETPSKPAGIEHEVDEDERIVNELYGNLPDHEKSRKVKEHYLWQFKKIAKAYPKMKLPEVDEHDDVEEIKTVYKRTMKDMTLDRSIADNRMYLMVGFFVVEYIGTSLVGIDIEGYADSQILMLDRYNELLIELGERSYNRWGTNFPVEIRLLFLMLINAFFFYIIKVMGDKGGKKGNNVYINIIKGMMSGNPNFNTSTENEKTGEKAVPPTKPKMKGPSITLDDIEEMED